VGRRVSLWMNDARNDSAALIGRPSKVREPVFRRQKKRGLAFAKPLFGRWWLHRDLNLGHQHYESHESHPELP